MKKFAKEFRDFALRGNVMDLAVGVIIGGAFQAIVSSLVENIIMPIVGIFVKNESMNNLVLNVGSAQIKYGAFIGTLINFIIMAFVVFWLVKFLNKLSAHGKKEQDAQQPTTKKCPYCFTDIPFEATRCPHCTAELPQNQAAK